jgi:small subunit ribosomal protein S17
MSPIGRRKTREGFVVSDRMEKTVVVAVEHRKFHPLYKKSIKATKKYKAHDENNACKIGDKVKIVETRPLSREKRWRVTEVSFRKETVETRPEQKE